MKFSLSDIAFPISLGNMPFEYRPFLNYPELDTQSIKRAADERIAQVKNFDYDELKQSLVRSSSFFEPSVIKSEEYGDFEIGRLIFQKVDLSVGPTFSDADFNQGQANPAWQAYADELEKRYLSWLGERLKASYPEDMDSSFVNWEERARVDYNNNGINLKFQSEWIRFGKALRSEYDSLVQDTIEEANAREEAIRRESEAQLFGVEKQRKLDFNLSIGVNVILFIIVASVVTLLVNNYMDGLRTKGRNNIQTWTQKFTAQQQQASFFQKVSSLYATRVYEFKSDDAATWYTSTLHSDIMELYDLPVNLDGITYSPNQKEIVIKRFLEDTQTGTPEVPDASVVGEEVSKALEDMQYGHTPSDEMLSEIYTYLAKEYPYQLCTGECSGNEEQNYRDLKFLHTHWLNRLVSNDGTHTQLSTEGHGVSETIELWTRKACNVPAGLENIFRQSLQDNALAVSANTATYVAHMSNCAVTDPCEAVEIAKQEALLHEQVDTLVDRLKAIKAVLVRNNDDTTLISFLEMRYKLMSVSLPGSQYDSLSFVVDAQAENEAPNKIVVNLDMLNKNADFAPLERCSKNESSYKRELSHLIAFQESMRGIKDGVIKAEFSDALMGFEKYAGLLGSDDNLFDTSEDLQNLLVTGAFLPVAKMLSNREWHILVPAIQHIIHAIGKANIESQFNEELAHLVKLRNAAVIFYMLDFQRDVRGASQQQQQRTLERSLGNPAIIQRVLNGESQGGDNIFIDVPTGDAPSMSVSELDAAIVLMLDKINGGGFVFPIETTEKQALIENIEAVRKIYHLQ